jgi:4-hydroxybenzoate polyprenyltransferase
MLHKSYSLETSFKNTVDNEAYHAVTLWLFTFSDLKTMVFPSTAFALSNGLAAFRAGTASSNTTGPLDFLGRIPTIILWAWINLLAFTVNNQRHVSALEADRMNKPWRPIPAGRLTGAQARNLGLVAYPIAFAASILLGGGTRQSALLALFGYLYNDLEGGDVNWLLRHVLNACGFICFASGALKVALQSHTKAGMIPWLFIIGAVVCTTVQTQDMYDQPGNSAAGRKTIPLVIGDGPARWSIAVAVAAWSGLAAMYWGSAAAGYLAPVTLGVWVGLRSLVKRSVEDDKTTSRLYNAWLVSIYILPLVKAYSVVVVA